MHAHAGTRTRARASHARAHTHTRTHARTHARTHTHTHTHARPQVAATSPCKLWVAERRVVATIKRHFAEKAASGKLDLLDKVPMFGVLTDAHKQLLAGALEQVRCVRRACAVWCAVCRVVCAVPAVCADNATTPARPHPRHNTHTRGCTQVSYAAGQLVWSERDPLNCQFFIIKDGAASLKDAGACLCVFVCLVGSGWAFLTVQARVHRSGNWAWRCHGSALMHAADLQPLAHVCTCAQALALC
jgi:hypothetical protein